jgi:two-component system sensor histidine kinase BarA
MHLPMVLIIDDLPDNIQIVANHLAEGYHVKIATSGPDGLELIQQTLPDLILLDAMMPGMDGYQVCERLKSDPRTRNVPIIFVTAKNDAESESLALAAGAVDFIHKPVNRDVLRARVQMHLALKARERELQAANAELGNLNAKLEAFNAELERRVEERTQALRDSMALTQAAQRARNLFLANVNHGLRTPMNAILGLSQLLARKAADPESRERADKIGQAGQELLRLVDGIIDIADLQAGKVQVDSADFELPALLDDALEAWRGQAAAKHLTLEREIDPGLPRFLQGDAKRLGQILDNLLSNAVKFSEGGRIAVRARLEERKEQSVSIRFEVEDQGVGIDPDRRHAIFDVFEQADNSRTRRYGGIGIGLAICKQLAGLMEGRLGVESEPGLGSTFWIVLPLNPGAVPARSEVPTSAPLPELERARQVLLDLTVLLAEDNEIPACITWIAEREVLDAVLGTRVDRLNQAMEALDFPAALEQLRAIRFP